MKAFKFTCEDSNKNDEGHNKTQQAKIDRKDWTVVGWVNTQENSQFGPTEKSSFFLLLKVSFEVLWKKIDELKKKFIKST